MIPTIGYIALITAFILSFLQVIIPMFGVFNNNIFCMKMAKPAAILQCFFIAISFFALMISFYRNDFSVLYVAMNSNSEMPALYRVCALWGAHAGSLLLWIFVLSVWSAAFALFSREIPWDLRSRILCVLGCISVFFYWFLFAHSNLYARVYPALPGGNLNPILQDIGLALHPPLLYAGYVGFSVAFAFAIAGLWYGEFNSQWATWMRPWTQIAWCFLTVGIVLGSWWSYRELGWGGFWFWDPVENASLMPWLTGTALIHVLIVTIRKNLFSAMTVLLSIATFSLSLLGTFLVRSGILISIHTFAVDPDRGLFLLRFLSIVVGGSLFLYAWRARLFIQKSKIQLWSVDSLILINNVLLFVAMLIVLLGTLYPMIINVLGLQTISVGAPYFNMVLLPLFILILFFLLFTVKIKNIGMICAHVGIFVMAIGIFLSAGFSHERKLSLKVGDQAHLSGYTFLLQHIYELEGPNYGGARATIRIEKENKLIAIVHPELRLFHHPLTVLPKAAIHASIFRDWYVALGMPLPNNNWTIQIEIKPFVRWIWMGGFLMMLGGLIAFFQRKSFCRSERTFFKTVLSRLI